MFSSLCQEFLTATFVSSPFPPPCFDAHHVLSEFENSCVRFFFNYNDVPWVFWLAWMYPWRHIASVKKTWFDCFCFCFFFCFFFWVFFFGLFFFGGLFFFVFFSLLFPYVNITFESHIQFFLWGVGWREETCFCFVLFCFVFLFLFFFRCFFVLFCFFFPFLFGVKRRVSVNLFFVWLLLLLLFYNVRDA